MIEERDVKKLPSVHYDRDLLEEVIKRIKRDDDSEVTIATEIGQNVRTANNVEEVFTDSLLPENITSFYIHANSDSGELLISGDGTTKAATHKLIIKGEESWRDEKTNAIKRILKANETSSLRSFLRGSRVKYLQMFLLSTLIFMDIRYFWPVLGVPFYAPMPTNIAIVSIAIILVLIGLEGINWLFPYVEICRNNRPSKLMRVFRTVAQLGGVITVIATAYQIINLLVG